MLLYMFPLLLVLWSLSSAELSKHAVDLEKRSIQFSLEEGTLLYSFWSRLLGL